MIHREPTNPYPPERPPYKFVEGNVDVGVVVEAAGLNPETYASQEFLLQKGLWDLFEVFSDSELRLVDQRDVSDPDRLLQSGSNRGEFYDKMTELQAASKYQSGPATDEMNKLARTCGWVFAEYVEQGKMKAPISTTTRPKVLPFDGSTIVQFDQYMWQGSSERPSIILEYGPGVSGRKFLDAQLEAIDRGIAPFQYICASDGPFVNQFLLTYLRNNLAERFDETPQERAKLQAILQSNRLLAGREDGMLQTTQHLLATPQPGNTTEVCDLILLTGVHEADPRELEATIKLTPQILQPEGRLLLAAPIDTAKDEGVPFGDQLRWAEQAGYVAEWQNMIPTGDVRLGRATTSGLVVLRK